MKDMIKKMLACICVVVLASGNMRTVAAVQSPTVSLQTEVYHNVAAKKANGIICRVDTNSDGTAMLLKIQATGKKKIILPETLKVNNVNYTVTAVGARAFANCKKLQKLQFPKTMNSICARAFTKAVRLKTITLTGKKVVTVETNAFKGLQTKKMKVKTHKKISGERFRQQKAALRNAGFKGNVKIKK